MSEEQVQDRSVIDGVKVVEVGVAKIRSNNIHTHELEDHPIPQIEECLLEDGRVVYRCNSKNGPCDYWKENPVSVRSHLRSHSDRMLARRLAEHAAEVEREAEAAKAELAARIQRKSEGSKRGAITRRQKLAAEANGHAPVDRVAAASQSNAKIEAIGAGIEAAIDSLAVVADTFDTIRRSLQGTLHELAKIEPAVAVDPDVLEKAAAFDQMQKLLGKK
jgi:hypothetical protein